MVKTSVTKKRSGTKDLIKSKIGVLSVVAMFYAIVCAGAYGIEEMIPECGPGLTIAMLVILPFIWALPYSFICAELGSARPVAGGSLIWVKEALGEFWFGIMVFSNVVWGLVCNTVYVVLAVGYLGSIIELSNTVSYILKVSMVLIFFIINVIGLKEVSIVSAILSVMIILAFAFVALVGFLNWNMSPVDPFISEEYDGLFPAIGAGLAIGLWMYSGFDELSVLAGEIKDAYRVIPKALMIVIPLIALTYILPTVGGLASIGEYESWTTEAGGVGYATVLTENLGPIYGVIFMIIAIIGQCSIFNVTITTGSRCILILADEHFGPKFVTKLTKKKSTPYVALSIVAFVTILLIPFDFTFLVVVDVFFMAIVVSLTVIAALILKRKIPDDEVPFKTPGGKHMHTLMCVVILVICVVLTLVNGTDFYLGGLIWILIIPILYIIGKLVYKGSTAKEPELYPINPRTRLGYGDLKKIGGMYMGVGAFAFVSRFFLEWYEGDWAVEYYLEEYGSGLFSNFSLMLTSITILGIVFFIIGALFILGNRIVER